MTREVQTTYEIENEGATWVPDQDDCIDVHGSVSPGDSCGQQFSYAELSLYGGDYYAHESTHDAYVMGINRYFVFFLDLYKPRFKSLIPNQRL